MFKRFFLVMIIVPVLICNNLIAQVSWSGKHPVEISAGIFFVGMPFSEIFIDKYYLSVSLGTEIYYRNKTHSKIFQTIKTGYYYNKYSTSALFLLSEIGYRYNLDFGLFADAGIGLGYSHLFRPGALNKLTGKGEYKEVRDWGRPSLMADYFMSSGYTFSENFKVHEMFLRYGNYLQLFYNPDLPVLPQNFFQIGTRF